MSSSSHQLTRRAASHSRASAARRGGPSPADSLSTSSSSSFFAIDWTVAAVAAVSLTVTGIKLYKAMHVPVGAGKVAVVYNARRRTIFATPLDRFGTLQSAYEFCKSRKAGTAGSLFTLSGLKLILAGAVFPACPAYVTKPPLPWYKIFEVPRAVLNSEVGIEMTCEVSDVPTKDGSLIDVDVTVQYYIDLNKDLERYLSLCGPVPPSGQVGKIIGYCVRSHTSNVDAGIVVSSNRREKYFMTNFINHVISKLMADCAVRVIAVRIDRAVEVSD